MKNVKKLIKKNQKGFSLVEILLAIVILSLVVTPILQVFVSSMSISGRSRDLLGATEVAQMTLEVLTSKSMDDAGGIKFMLTDPGQHVILPALSSYNPTNTAFGGSASTHGGFVNSLKSSYSSNTNELCLYADGTDVKRFALHNVEHNNTVYDVVVSMTANPPAGALYYTYDVYLEVFEAEDNVHYSKSLLAMESAVVNKY